MKRSKKNYIKPHPASRTHNKEKDITKYLLGDFIPEGSIGEALIEEITCHQINEITLPCVAQIGTILSDLSKIKLERNWKRSKQLLIKWFNDNESEIRKWKDCITTVYYDKTDIL